jgi:hypothetical protein
MLMRNLKAVLLASVALTLAAFAGCDGSSGGTTTSSPAAAGSTCFAVSVVGAGGTSVATGGGGVGFGGAGATATATSVVTSGTGGAGGDLGDPCNPVTGAPCQTAKGETCDFNGDGYICYMPPNTQTICETCNPLCGPYCGVGTTCVAGPAKPATCTVPNPAPSMGACYNANGTGGAGGGTDGGATSGSGGAGGVADGGATSGAGGADGGTDGGATSGTGGMGGGQGGAASSTGFCAAFCCTSADCGGGTCDLAAGALGVGICT